MSHRLKELSACLLAVALAILLVGGANAQTVCPTGTETTHVASVSPTQCTTAHGSLSFTAGLDDCLNFCQEGGSDVALLRNITATSTSATPETLSNCDVTVVLDITDAASGDTGSLTYVIHFSGTLSSGGPVTNASLTSVTPTSLILGCNAYTPQSIAYQKPGLTNVGGLSSTITCECVAPVISGCPANATYTCASEVPACTTDLSVFLSRGGTLADRAGNPITDISGIPADCAALSCNDVISNQTGANCYTITRTYTLATTQPNGSCPSTECVQTITVSDTVDPSITCPAAVTVTGADNVPAHATDYTSFVAQGGAASDNCAGTPTVTFVSDVPSGTTCPYTITRTYRATDECGNSADCTQLITVNCPPTICTFTKGYYRNHPNAVTSTCLTASGLSVGQANAILQATPGKPGSVTFTSNDLLNLAQQYITAVLNLCGTSGPSQVNAAIATFQSSVTISGTSITTSLSQTQISGLINTLSSFNEGSISGFPHCAD